MVLACTRDSVNRFVAVCFTVSLILFLPAELKDLIYVLLDDEPEYRITTAEIFPHKWFYTGVTLRPESTSKKTGTKFNRENCGIPLPPLHKEYKKLESQFLRAEREYLAAARPSAAKPFLSKLGQRLTSAAKPKRNASQ